MQLTRNLVSSFCMFNVSLQFLWGGGGGGVGGWVELRGGIMESNFEL